MTTHTDVDHAGAWYYRHALIETYVSEQLRRGVRITRSHRSDPVRCAHLLSAPTRAYLRVVYLGVGARRDAVRGGIHTIGSLRSRSVLARLAAAGLWCASLTNHPA